MTDQDDQKAAEESAPSKNASAEQNTVYAGSPVQFNDNIVIFPDKALPDYDRGPVKAYAAQGKGKVPEQIYTLVCDPVYASRSSKAPSYATLSDPSLPRLIATGPTYWPIAGEERYIFIYHNTGAKRLVKDNTQSIALGWKPDLVINAVIKPLTSALIDLRNKDIIHGSIRPGNLFTAGSQNKVETAILGDCLALPGGYDMPVVCETIERAMADPIARGVGTHTDEMYSFGVMLALLLRSSDPLAAMSSEEIIQHKIEHGSFSALIGKDRITGSVLELLRGLLYDSPLQRWELDDVEAWLEGERLTPKSAGKKIKANRPLAIGSRKYILPELIAQEANKNPKELVDTIENGEMEQWLDRAVDDKGIKDRFQQAYTLSQEKGQDSMYHYRLAARVSIAMHPHAPLRYKNLQVFPDGVGKALSAAIQKGDNIQDFHEFIEEFFVMQWLDMYGTSGVDNSSIMARFGTCRKFLQQKLISFGIERCVYYLSEETHCLSNKLKGYFVRNAEDMIHAFEKIAHSPNRPAYFFDRHSVAFLSVKDKQVIDKYLHELQSREKYQLVLGELKVLENIQRHFRMEKFPGVAAWMVSNMDPLFERIHDRELKAELKKKIEKEKQSGNLTKLLAFFESEKVFRDDYSRYRTAMHNYVLFHKEKEQLTEDIQSNKNFGQDAGKVAAAITSCIIAAMVILLTIVMDF